MSGTHVSKQLPFVSQAVNILEYYPYFTKRNLVLSFIGFLHVPLFDKKKKSFPSLGPFMSHYLTKKRNLFLHWVHVPLFVKKKSFFFPHWVHVPLFDQKEIFFFPLGFMSHYLTKKIFFFFSPHWVHVPLFVRKEIFFFPHWVHVPPSLPPFHV